MGSNGTAPFRFFFLPLLGDCLDEFPALSSCDSAQDDTPTFLTASLGSLLSSTAGLDSPLLLLLWTLSSEPISLFCSSSPVFISLSRSFSASPSEFSLSLARRSWQRLLFRVLRWFFLRWPSMLEFVLKFAFQNIYLISYERKLGMQIAQIWSGNKNHILVFTCVNTHREFNGRSVTCHTQASYCS